MASKKRLDHDVTANRHQREKSLSPQSSDFADFSVG
jgi:hypothetical protein